MSNPSEDTGIADLSRLTPAELAARQREAAEKLARQRGVAPKPPPPAEPAAAPPPPRALPAEPPLPGVHWLHMFRWGFFGGLGLWLSWVAVVGACYAALTQLGAFSRWIGWR